MDVDIATVCYRSVCHSESIIRLMRTLFVARFSPRACVLVSLMPL